MQFEDNSQVEENSSPMEQQTKQIGKAINLNNKAVIELKQSHY